MIRLGLEKSALKTAWRVLKSTMLPFFFPAFGGRMDRLNKSRNKAVQLYVALQYLPDTDRIGQLRNDFVHEGSPMVHSPASLDLCKPHICLVRARCRGKAAWLFLYFHFITEVRKNNSPLTRIHRLQHAMFARFCILFIQTRGLRRTSPPWPGAVPSKLTMQQFGVTSGDTKDVTSLSESASPKSLWADASSAIRAHKIAKRNSWTWRRTSHELASIFYFSELADWVSQRCSRFLLFLPIEADTVKEGPIKVKHTVAIMMEECRNCCTVFPRLIRRSFYVQTQDENIHQCWKL